MMTLTVALAAGCASMSSAPPAVPAGWTPVDAATGRLSSLADVTRLSDQFPESANVQRRLLSAAMRDKNTAQVEGVVSRLGAMDYALRSSTIASLAPVIGEAAASAAEARAAAVRGQVGASAVFATVPAQHRLVEGVAWDARNRRLYVSSIADRALLTIDDDRGQPVAGIDGGSLSGLAIDEGRRILWIASGVADPTPDPTTAFRGLIAYNLDRRMVVSRAAAPQGAQFPSDLGIGRDGTVYASDSLGGGVYRLRPGATVLETLVPTGTLRSPQGIAIHPDGRRIYVGDYNYGIAIIDLASGAVSRLAADLPMALDGVDGLYWDNGSLIGIQNGTSPMRIIRISLDRSGRRATGLAVIEAANSAWGEPTIGQIVDGNLLYVSAPQWDRFEAGGKVKGSEPLRPNPVRIVALRKGVQQLPR